ncbi:hypothetical protein ANO11243_092460 [Dothideomycetidae sp. 11243]|nr:hypothetical protein ANO11243_092460 [fungal sp. No.11243]
MAQMQRRRCSRRGVAVPEGEKTGALSSNLGTDTVENGLLRGLWLAEMPVELASWRFQWLQGLIIGEARDRFA